MGLSTCRLYLGALATIVRSLSAQFNDGLLASGVVTAIVSGPATDACSASELSTTLSALATLCGPRGVCVHQLFVLDSISSPSCNLRALGELSVHTNGWLCLYHPLTDADSERRLHADLSTVATAPIAAQVRAPPGGEL